MAGRGTGFSASSQEKFQEVVDFLLDYSQDAF
jgi:hypothetical protein